MSQAVERGRSDEDGVRPARPSTVTPRSRSDTSTSTRGRIVIRCHASTFARRVSSSQAPPA